MTKDQPTILIIFGISGDLSKRYLLPAINEIANAGMLPKEFQVVGITRDLTRVSHLKNKIGFFKMDLDDLADYRNLSFFLSELEKNFSTPPQRIFYLSVPPNACHTIVKHLGQSDLLKKGEAKLLLEKPFGIDLASAKKLAKHVVNNFKEGQVYRIDHYLAKEAVQNIIVFRTKNSLFEKTWNRKFIEKIDIIASEKIDIEGRVHFYEQTGALRDNVQSHLMQLLALTLMNLPNKYDIKNVHSYRLNALRKLTVGNVIRGQYDGYRKETNNPISKVETFVSVNLKSSDPNWQGIPITITSGKALKEKSTKIVIKYKKSAEHGSNELTLKLQPDACMEFSVMTKRPGYEYEVSPQILRFSFKDNFPKLPEAYEQIILSAINSDHSLFATSDEVIESWKIIDKIRKKWDKYDDLVIYKKGSDIENIIKLPLTK